MKPSDRLEWLRAQLFLRSAGSASTYEWRVFYAALASRVPVVYGPSPAGTAHTDGRSITFAPEFMARETDAALQFVLLHELEHIIRHHVQRGVGLDLGVWNQAADAVINRALRQEGFTPPQTVQVVEYDWVRDGMSEEEVYARLLSGQQPATRAGGTPVEDGGDRASDSRSPAAQAGGTLAKDLAGDGDGGGLSDEEIHRAVAEAAAAAASMAGSIPGRVDAWLDAQLQVRVPWQVVLRRVLGSALRVQRSWARLNRRGLLAPGKMAQTDQVGVVLDTSGSMSDTVIAQCFGLIRDLADRCGCKVAVWQCDTEVYGPDVYPPRQVPAQWQIHGRGGTCMGPAAAAVAAYRHPLAAVVWLTDGEWADRPALPARIPHYLVLIGGTNVPAARWASVIQVSDTGVVEGCSMTTKEGL